MFQINIIKIQRERYQERKLEDQTNSQESQKRTEKSNGRQRGKGYMGAISKIEGPKSLD